MAAKKKATAMKKTAVVKAAPAKPSKDELKAKRQAIAFFKKIRSTDFDTSKKSVKLLNAVISKLAGKEVVLTEKEIAKIVG